MFRANDQNVLTSGTTWVYEYDRGGNILSKTRYAYTTGTVGAALQTISYTYGDSNWKDKLTQYNGATISYDNIGNPTSDGTWTYTWQNGRQLQQMSKSDITASFVYNAEGQRVQKNVRSTVVNRFYPQSSSYSGLLFLLLEKQNEGTYGIHMEIWNRQIYCAECSETAQS